MCSVCQPSSDSVNVLTGADRRRVSNDRNQIPPPPRLDLQDGESGIRVVERHTFDAADQALATRGDLLLRLVANKPSPAARA